MNNIKVLVTEYFAQTYPSEWDAMIASFGKSRIVTQMSEVSVGDVVLPRYRTVPFGDLLESEAVQHGARLINSAAESSRIRDIYSWAGLLEGLTAPCYSLEDVDSMPQGAYFVKGQTSSLKNRGPQAVFAQSKEGAVDLARAILTDDWISHEKPVMRPMQDYLWLGTSERGLPVFHERRVFTYAGTVLAQMFYWDSQRNRLDVPVPLLSDAFYQTLVEAVDRVKDVAPFLVIDMAEYENGDWGVVELNDGCQSGIVGNMDFEVYSALAACFR